MRSCLRQSSKPWNGPRRRFFLCSRVPQGSWPLSVTSTGEPLPVLPDTSAYDVCSPVVPAAVAAALSSPVVVGPGPGLPLAHRVYSDAELGLDDGCLIVVPGMLLDREFWLLDAVLRQETFQSSARAGAVCCFYKPDERVCGTSFLFPAPHVCGLDF